MIIIEKQNCISIILVLHLQGFKNKLNLKVN